MTIRVHMKDGSSNLYTDISNIDWYRARVESGGCLTVYREGLIGEEEWSSPLDSFAAGTWTKCETQETPT
jgi:hypothetical protein